MPLAAALKPRTMLSVPEVPFLPAASVIEPPFACWRRWGATFIALLSTVRSPAFDKRDAAAVAGFFAAEGHKLVLTGTPSPTVAA